MEAQEITDEWQILAPAGLIRVCECSGNDVAKFANFAYVNATHIWINWIKRKSPAHGSVRLPLRSENAHKALVVERRDDERMMRKPGFLYYPINLGLTGKVERGTCRRRSLLRQAALTTGILGSPYRRGCLLKLVSAFFPKIGD